MESSAIPHVEKGGSGRFLSCVHQTPPYGLSTLAEVGSASNDRPAPLSGLRKARNPPSPAVNLKWRHSKLAIPRRPFGRLLFFVCKALFRDSTLPTEKLLHT